MTGKLIRAGWMFVRGNQEKKIELWFYLNERLDWFFE